MNEELKLVTEALTALGAEGKTAFIIWCVCQLLKPLVIGCGFAIVLITGRHAIAKIVIAVKQSNEI